MKITCNGINIHVNAQGENGQALVFLHYWGGSSRTWKHVQSVLSPTFRTFALDHRGWGESDAPAEGYGLTELADDAMGVIAALGLSSYVLVGHSMGGKVAQLIASRRPSELAGLILIAPAPPSPMALPEAARTAMTHAYDSRASVEATLDQVLTARPISREDREQVISDSLRAAAAAKQAWPMASSQQDISKQVEHIEVPTLVVAGELDRVDPPEILRQSLLAHLPHAVMEVLPGTGHLAMLEAPDAVAAAIENFCQRLPAVA